MHNLVIYANVFVRRKNKILMIRRSLKTKFFPGYVQPIGGKVEPYEDPLSAAKRELLEEAGIRVTNMKLKVIVTEIKNNKDKNYQANWQIFHFVGNYDGTKISKTKEGELIWLTLEQIKKEKVSNSIKLIIDDVLNKTKNVTFAKFLYGKDNVFIKKLY